MGLFDFLFGSNESSFNTEDYRSMSEDRRHRASGSGNWTSREDWSGGGRKEHYVDLYFDKIIDCNFCPVLSSVFIEKKIYDFDWHGGYSGRWLDVYRSYDLISLWSHHSYKISKDPKMSKKVYCPVLKC